MESIVPEEPVRMSRLNWVVLNDECKIVRGYSFNIDPTDWGMTEQGAVNQTGDSFDRIATIGHPVATVLQKFIDDHDACDTVFCVDCDAAFAILIYEAKRAGLRANRPITDRRSMKEFTDKLPDMKNGMQPLVDFFIRKCPNELFEFTPVSEL